MSKKRLGYEELAALRKSGKKNFSSYEVQEVQNLYEEVDEESYKKLFRDRLDQDDFVVDDNGEGYADDGREDCGRAQVYESDIEDDLHIRGKKKDKRSKKQREDDGAQRDAANRNISEFFTNGAGKIQPRPKAVNTEEDDQFLAGLLEEVDQSMSTTTTRQSKIWHRSGEKRRARTPSPPPEVRRRAPKKARLIHDKLPNALKEDSSVGGDNAFISMDEDYPLSNDLTSQEIPLSDPAPSSPTVKVAERMSKFRADAEEDDDNGIMEVAHAGSITAASVNLSACRAPEKIIKPDPCPSPASSPLNETAPNHEADSSAWKDINSRLNLISSFPSNSRGIYKIDYKDAIGEDGSINIFWTDYTEVNSSLCLFGKVLNKKTNAYVSCFVKVENILRKLYFLPRKTRVVNGIETSDKVGMEDVHKEVDTLMTKMNVDTFKIKGCTRKYAFELPDVPKEGHYMKLFYPYSKPQIESITTGESFSRIFGSNTTLFEQFVLWKNIMGPCWLKITDANFGALKNASHCRLEILVENPNMIEPTGNSDNLDAPPLTLMSMAMRTTFNVKENRQDILAISARIYESVSLNDTTPADKIPSRTFTLIRPNGSTFPMGFEQAAKNRTQGLIKTMKQETEMLAFFLAQLDLADPDVILGHRFEGVDYSVLLNRLHQKKIHQWSRIGRLRRSNWPSSVGKVGGNEVGERQIMAGRLLCDLANDAGKSAMSKCSTWSLTEMCSLYLSGNNIRRDFDNEMALKSWAENKDGLMDYVSHVETDTYFIMALALKVQLLPLTKVLTNLAGNSWARTLTGTRVERNEYILLHEFHRNKYICPDKQTIRGRQRFEQENAQEETEGKKRAKYKGGLVFEPEKGLYDKFILVMDFNSLYPSIIQEFNICYTTVDRTSLSVDEDAVPELPVEQHQGILPKLIATLVSRRRQVKGLMKDKNATAEELATWEIKQLALKLTANSMYGCLGYPRFRFYARPLAVLITYKGREILRSTQELAESKSLQVIYGDTDSVMINANVNNVQDAFAVGHEFKKAVNERYKLLEIDIDNVFRRILFQAKKKYAAINLIESEGRFIEKMEVKGLDIKRREYCGLSKAILSRLLNEILSGDETEVSIARIHDYLRDIAGKMREAAVSVPKYLIFTQLGKAPQEYPNGDSMPQVQVALRELSRGNMVRKGDVISYIITGDSRSSDSVAKRAYTLQDVLKQDSGLAPDVEWYIGKQIFPPVERLCANIVGTSTAQLAECLGLDIRRYANNVSHSSNGNSHDIDIHPLESQIPDNVRFRNCARLELRCRSCKVTSPFEGLFSNPDRVKPSGVACGSCDATMPTLSIVAQVERGIRIATAKYYEGWLVCDDSSCGNRTRQMSVYGSRCLGPQGLARDCLGRMRYEVSERDLYNQLLYFASLWDVDKARTKACAEGADAEAREKILALAEHNRTRFGTVKGVVGRYLDKCGRQWVAMDTIFNKLGFVAT